MSLMTDEELPCGVGRFLRAFWGEGSRFYECVVFLKKAMMVFVCCVARTNNHLHTPPHPKTNTKGVPHRARGQGGVRGPLDPQGGAGRLLRRVLPPRAGRPLQPGMWGEGVRGMDGRVCGFGFWWLSMHTHVSRYWVYIHKWPNPIIPPTNQSPTNPKTNRSATAAGSAPRRCRRGRCRCSASTTRRSPRTGS